MEITFKKGEVLKNNVDLIFKLIDSNDVVLDIGGWAQPFNRANYIIDIMPYETRGFFGCLGAKKEFFSKETWIYHDVSSSSPLPFKDKEIDFVICSHVLEDVRDPLRLCSEIIRIGRRGYIEVPSRTVESIMGLEGKHYAGYSHHRWLIEMEGSKIVFRNKPHLLHSSPRFYLPKSYPKRLKEKDKISYLLWNGSFEYEEIIQISYQKIAKELEKFVKSKFALPYSYVLEQDLKRMVKSIIYKLSGKSATDADKKCLWDNVPDINSR